MRDGTERPREAPGVRRALWRGATRRCPACGHGGLFRSWFRMVERCPGCGFGFEREPGHWVGALGINTVLTFGTLLLTIVIGIVWTAPEIPVWPLVVASCLVAVGVPLAAFPFARTLWSAIDLLMRPAEDADFEDTDFDDAP